jgi:hypothetical protein
VKHGSMQIRVIETDVLFSEINLGVCFAKTDRMLLTVYIKVDEETAIGVNVDGTIRPTPEMLINVVRFGDGEAY